MSDKDYQREYMRKDRAWAKGVKTVLRLPPEQRLHAGTELWGRVYHDEIIKNAKYETKFMELLRRIRKAPDAVSRDAMLDYMERAGAVTDEGVQGDAHIGPANHRRRMMDELQETVETLIELNEPEALLSTLRREAAKKKGKRWEALAKVLDEADWKLDQILNAKPVSPEPTVDAEAEKA